MNWDTIPKWLMGVLKSLSFVMVAIGGLAYIIHYISTLTALPNSNAGSVPSPLDLAAVAGTIGALLLVGAFTKTTPEVKLKRIGKYFLGAAVFFTIAFLMMEWARVTNSSPLTFWEQAMTWVSAIAVVLGIGGLTGGLIELAWSLPKL